MKKNRLAARKTEQREARRFDRPGHLDPEHAGRLLDLSSASRSETYKAFVGFAPAHDELAVKLTQSTLRKMTRGEEAFTDELDEPVVLEGGPFVVHAVADQWPEEPLILEVDPPPEPFDSSREPLIADAPHESMAEPAPQKAQIMRVATDLFKKIPPLSDILTWAKSRAEKTTHKLQGWSRHQLARTRRRAA